MTDNVYVTHRKKERQSSAVITRNNHYVPQFYLKAWADKRKQIRVYDTLVPSQSVPLWRTQSIKSAASWPDFYTHSISPNPDEDDDFTEDALDRDIEQPASEVLRRLADNGTQPGFQDSEILANFTLIQYLRTPAGYLRLRDTIDAIELPPITGAPPSDDLPCEEEGIGIRPTGMIEKGSLLVEIAVNRATHQFCMKRLLHGMIGQLFRSSAWTIADMPATVTLPTSDDPTVRIPMSPRSRGLKGSLVLLPISPHRILYTILGASRATVRSAWGGTMTAAGVRRAVIRNAYRYIYSSNPEPPSGDGDVPVIRPRTASAALWEAKNRERVEWSDTQRLSEVELPAKMSRARL